MNITKQEHKKMLSDQIALIKVEFLNEDIYTLMDLLGLDQRKIDKQVDRIKHAMSMPTNKGHHLDHWDALEFLNDLDQIWEDK
tara:strand:- start:3357 stop:3605 length:249 start_codon:yes stop_codon:yes gene_type:complete